MPARERKGLKKRFADNQHSEKSTIGRLKLARASRFRQNDMTRAKMRVEPGLVVERRPREENSALVDRFLRGTKHHGLTQDAVKAFRQGHRSRDGSVEFENGFKKSKKKYS